MAPGLLRTAMPLVAATWLALHPHASEATVTEKDVAVVGRLIALLQNGPKGRVTVAIVEGSRTGKEDAAAFQRLVGASGKAIGPVTLLAFPVAYDALAGIDSRVVFVPPGLSDAELDAVFAVAKAQKLITISNDQACLRRQRCALSIQTEPAVDIRLSIAAASATEVGFGSTFRMMIKEVE